MPRRAAALVSTLSHKGQHWAKSSRSTPRTRRSNRLPSSAGTVCSAVRNDLLDLRIEIAGRTAGDRHAPLRTGHHQLEIELRLAIREHDGALDVVLQLAHVAGHG